MNKRTIITILALFLGIFVSSTKAHSPWGACATLYLDKDKGGASHDVCHSGYLSKDFNKKVSSILIPDGFNMRLFKTPNYKGKFLDIQAGVNNLNVDWDNQVSSVQFNNWGDGSATLYTGPNRSGSTFTVCSDANLVEGYGGVIQSIYVLPLHFFRLYKNADFTGDWIDIRGSYTFKSDWLGDNQAKSMRIQHWAECAWFHNDPNRGGRFFQVCDSGTFPAAWAKLASSITVPKKMTVTVFKQPEYKGESKAFTEGVWNLDGGWDNAIVSVKVEIEGKMTGKS